MRFGPLPVGQAVGSLAAHTVRTDGLAIRKGTRVSADQARALAAAGVDTLVAVTLDPGDVGEDEAAARVAAAAAGFGIRVERPFTGRANLFATVAGILLVDDAAIRALNAVDESVTLATLPAFRPVVAGEMVATAKIIPYAVAGPVLAEAERAIGHAAVSVAPYRLRRVAAVSTLAPGLKPSVVRKTLAALAGRLAPAGAVLVETPSVPHEEAALAAVLARLAKSDAELVVVFGASAIADRRDVIPAAIEAAGGRVDHLGMPVDPGNLLLVGRLGGRPIIGAPGCARSPRENGFDWVLGRMLAGLAVTRADIAGMGVGGLLMEIGARGQTRAGEGEAAEP